MKKHLMFLLVSALLTLQYSFAQIELGNTTVEFATKDEAVKIIAAADDFVLSMSSFDRAVRLKSKVEVSREQYLDYATSNILDWQSNDKHLLDSVLISLQPAFEKFELPFPDKVLLIKTTGDEEGGAPYTRANAIILPQSITSMPAEGLQQLICHELFHILSRTNPVLRDSLYAAIGFHKCDDVVLPQDLRDRKITNPDAPKNEHCITLLINGKEQLATPVLFSTVQQFDTAVGMNIFDYLQFEFLIVKAPEGHVSGESQIITPQLVAFQQVSGFLEQVGRNTQYIIHPEEILADNFAFLILGKQGLPSPQVTLKMRKILSK